MKRDRGSIRVPPPETPPSPPPQNPNSFINLYNSFQKKRDRSSIRVPPPPPPETPPSSPFPPPQNPNSFINPYNSLQMQRERSPTMVPPPPPLQSHRCFSSFSPQLLSILGPYPGAKQISTVDPHQNNEMMMKGPNQIEPCCQMQPPIGGGAPSHFEQEMMPVTMRPPFPPPPTYQDIWPYFPPAQMMDHGFVNNSFRPLDLGNFPPWQITVNVADGQTRSFNIPNPEGNCVVGLPLGSDVPEVIAGHYEGLLRMVQGMKDVIKDIVGESARYQQDAARFWKDANRYYCELGELKFRMGGNMVVSQAPVSRTKKRKMIPRESSPWEAKTVQIDQYEHPPLSIASCGGSSSTVFPVQAPATKDNEIDVPFTSMKCLEDKFVNKETLLYSSEVQTETVEFFEPVGESVEATSSSTMYQTEGFEFVENFKIPKEYANLYKNISNKYGHMATRNVIKCNDAVLLMLVVRLLKNISAVESVPVAELSELFLDSWEGDIKVAETLQFNIKWLRQKFNQVKKCWRLDKDIERHEQELDSVQLKYVGLWARRVEIDIETAEVKAQIRNAEAKISSEREAIKEKLAQIYDQICSLRFMV